MSVAPRRSPVWSSPWRTPIISAVNTRPVGPGKWEGILTCWVNSTKVSHSGCPRRMSDWAWLLSPQQMRSHACCSQHSVEGAPAACPPSPPRRGLMQTAQRGRSVSLALMWRGQCLGAVTVQNWWEASAVVYLSIRRLIACATITHPNPAECTRSLEQRDPFKVSRC